MSTELFLIVLITPCIVGAQLKTNYGIAKGATMNIMWEYNNPRRLLQTGPTWLRKIGGKMTFHFCLRNPKTDSCNLWVVSKDGYSHSKFISDRLNIKLKSPVPEEMMLDVDIKMSWFSMLPTTVANFMSPTFSISANETIHRVALHRKGDGHRNNDVTFEVTIKLRCDEFYYGKKCETFCEPVLHRFDCSPEGKKICHPGLAGEYCDQRDSCYFEGCAEYATCINDPQGNGRQCFCNGGEGPECYPNRNPCALQPCKNGGMCQPVMAYNQSFKCVCTNMWQGPLCTERRSACDETFHQMRESLLLSDASVNSNSISVSVCLNGGKCFEDPNRFAFYCVCPAEWTGDRCEVLTVKPYTVKFLLLILGIPLLSFAILLGVTIYAIIVWSKRHKKKRVVVKSKMEFVPGSTSYLPGKYQDSRMSIKSKLSTNNIEPSWPQSMSTSSTNDPLKTGGCSVYDDYCEDNYVDMTPFDIVYRSPDPLLEPTSDAEPNAPALPNRPLNLYQNLSTSMRNTEVSEAERTSQTVTTSDASSARHSFHPTPGCGRF